jgi:hypothetical protein
LGIFHHSAKSDLSSKIFKPCEFVSFELTTGLLKKIAPPSGAAAMARFNSTPLLLLMIGYVRAKEYLLTGDLMPATEAARIGLINYAVAAS